jgi:hypothetical protein
MPGNQLWPPIVAYRKVFARFLSMPSLCFEKKSTRGMCDDAVAAAPSISRHENANATRRLYLFCTWCQLFSIYMDNPAWYLSAINSSAAAHNARPPTYFWPYTPIITEGLSLCRGYRQQELVILCLLWPCYSDLHAKGLQGLARLQGARAFLEI